MQKLFWIFCVMNFTLIQSYYIRRAFTVGHNCPVPVDKHDSDTNFTPTTPDPLGGIKGQMFKFCNKLKTFINIFTENSHAGRSTIDMKHIK